MGRERESVRKREIERVRKRQIKKIAKERDRERDIEI